LSVTVTEEEVVVEKRLVAKEELRTRKDVVEGGPPRFRWKGTIKPLDHSP
jgi:hypothetical protein